MCTAPTGPPLNVSAVGISSSVVLVMWGEVPELEQNGFITEYEVEYNQTAFDDIDISDTIMTDSSLMMVNLTGLEEFTEYFIRVRAFTIHGPGPYSNAVSVSTLEDGKAVTIMLVVLRELLDSVCRDGAQGCKH